MSTTTDLDKGKKKIIVFKDRAKADRLESYETFKAHQYEEDGGKYKQEQRLESEQRS